MTEMSVSPRRFLAVASVCMLAISAFAAPSWAATASEHRVYPGSEDAANQQLRAQKNAPNMYCEKHQQDCE